MKDYELLIRAYKLKRLDREREIHLQAWVINQAKATKQMGGKTYPVFKDFNSFFNFDKRQKQITNEKQDVSKKREQERLKRIAQWANNQ